MIYQRNAKCRLFVDFDGTVSDSITNLSRMYNEEFKNHPDFVPAVPENGWSWGLMEICPLKQKQLMDYFKSEDFFKNIVFFPDALPVLYQLNLNYEVYICTIGVPENLEWKTKYFRMYLPQFKYILINNEDCTMNKDMVNMSEGLFMDDSLANLNSSNAQWKFVYGKELQFNENAPYPRLANWAEVKKALL